MATDNMFALSNNAEVKAAIAGKRVFWAEVYYVQWVRGERMLQVNIPIANAGDSYVPGYIPVKDLSDASSYYDFNNLIGVYVPFTIKSVDENEKCLICSSALLESRKRLGAIPPARQNAYSHTTERKVQNGDIILGHSVVEGKSADTPEILPRNDRFLHVLVLGPAGCGKTSQTLLPMIHQDIQNKGWGVTVIDPKGDLAVKVSEMAKYYKRDVVLFDPTFDECPKFNPLSGAENDAIETVVTAFRMANSSIPSFFAEQNELTIRNGVRVLKRLDKAEGVDGKYANLINLNRLLVNANGMGRDIVNKFSTIIAKTNAEAAEDAAIASWFLNQYFPSANKEYENASHIRSMLDRLISNPYMYRILNPDYDKGECSELRFDQYLKDGTVVCISTAQGILRDLSKTLGYFVSTALQCAVLRRPRKEEMRPHTIYLDEFVTCANPTFDEMLAQGRRNSVSVVIAAQSREKIVSGVNGETRGSVDALSGQLRNVILFHGLNSRDAKYYSEQFGEKDGIPNFSVADLVYGKEIGASREVVYSIVQDGSVQPAKVGTTKSLQSSLEKEINSRVEKYVAEHVWDPES